MKCAADYVQEQIRAVEANDWRGALAAALFFDEISKRIFYGFVTEDELERQLTTEVSSVRMQIASAFRGRNEFRGVHQAGLRVLGRLGLLDLSEAIQIIQFSRDRSEVLSIVEGIRGRNSIQIQYSLDGALNRFNDDAARIALRFALYERVCCKDLATQIMAKLDTSSISSGKICQIAFRLAGDGYEKAKQLCEEKIQEAAFAKHLMFETICGYGCDHSNWRSKLALHCRRQKE